MKRRTIIKAVLGILFLAVLIIINVGPVVWALSTSLKSLNEILEFPPRFIGSRVTLEHYSRVLISGFPRNIRNSIFYSGSAVFLTLFLGCLAAYGLDRFKFSGKKLFLLLIIASIPTAIARPSVVIPTYVYLSKLGMVNRWYTLVVLYTVYNLPMVTWILKGSFEAVPKEIDESAMVDGCPRIIILFKIVIPLTVPGLAAAALFTFLGSWNDFIVASIMTSSAELEPLQLGVYHYMGCYGLEWGALMAASIMAIIPIMVFFGFLQKYFVTGLMKGSVKG